MIIWYEIEGFGTRLSGLLPNDGHKMFVVVVADAVGANKVSSTPAAS